MCRGTLAQGKRKNCVVRMMKFKSILLLMIVVSLSFSFFHNFNCSSVIKSDQVSNIYDVEIALVTLDKENPYGPIKGLPASLGINFTVNMSDEVYSNRDGVYATIDSTCDTGGGVTGMAFFNPILLSENEGHKVVKFVYQQKVNIPEDAIYCYLNDFTILGHGLDRYTNASCDDAYINGMTGADHLSGQTFYPISISLYNDWRIAEDQKNINLLLCVIALLSTGAALYSAYVNKGAVNLARIQTRISENQLKEVVRQNGPKIRIYATADYEKDISDIYLIIGNFGADVAYNLSFKITPDDVKDQVGRLLTSYPFLNHMSQLGPESKFVHYLKNGVGLKDAAPFEISIKYENRDGVEYSDSFVIDLQTYEGMGYIRRKKLHDLVLSVEKLVSPLVAIIDRNYGLKVITKTQTKADEDMVAKIKKSRKRRWQKKDGKKDQPKPTQ